MKTVGLPTSITLGGHVIPLYWTERPSLDGFIAEVKSGVPVENFLSSEDCELAIWAKYGLKSDVYLDGSALIHHAAP